MEGFQLRNLGEPVPGSFRSVSTSTDFPELVDPLDGSTLTSVQDTLRSSSRSYPVIVGIPRMTPVRGNYTDAFGEQWNRWRRTQLDSHTGVPITRLRLERCLGAPLLAMLSKQNQTLDVLEAGCGAGRFTEVLLGLRAVRLTSIDLSSAVEANQLNFPQDHRHRIVQCDIRKPPFRQGSFDVVVCLGVIQHTPDPEQTIASLYSQVRPGGWLVIDHYAPNWARRTKFAGLLLRPLLKRLPPRVRMRACEVLTECLLPAHRAVRNVPLARIALARLSPVLSMYHVYPELSEQSQREWALLDTHDALTDWFKHLRTPRQIQAVLESMGAESVIAASGGNGVEARCRKPQSVT